MSAFVTRQISDINHFKMNDFKNSELTVELSSNHIIELR